MFRYEYKSGKGGVLTKQSRNLVFPLMFLNRFVVNLNLYSSPQSSLQSSPQSSPQYLHLNICVMMLIVKPFRRRWAVWEVFWRVLPARLRGHYRGHQVSVWIQEDNPELLRAYCWWGYYTHDHIVSLYRLYSMYLVNWKLWHHFEEVISSYYRSESGYSEYAI